jgi:signal peptidase II
VAKRKGGWSASGGRSGADGIGLWLGIAALVIVADQLTKTLIIGSFQLGDSRTVTSFFNLVRVHNSGAAFSFLAGASGWQRWFFVGLGTAATAFIVWMLRRHPGQRLFCTALALILGGAVGNVVDRLLHGHVIDFLQFHWGWLAPIFPGGYFPSFNIADSAISAGAACLVLDEILRVRRSG